MELSRMGANRKEVRSVAFTEQKPEIMIDSKTGDLKLSIRYANGMGTQGQYNYLITLSPEDFFLLLHAVAAERSAFQPGNLQATLQSSAAALLRLISAASLLPFQLAPTEAQLKFQAAQAKLAAKRAATGDT